MTTTADRPGTTIATNTFERDWQAWHAEHESNLAAPHGFLAITGLH